MTAKFCALPCMDFEWCYSAQNLNFALSVYQEQDKIIIIWLEQEAQGFVASSFLEIFQSCLDTVLDILL